MVVIKQLRHLMEEVKELENHIKSPNASFHSNSSKLLYTHYLPYVSTFHKC